MPPPRDDLYAVLGVGRDATSTEVRDAYRRLARKLHPDRARDAGDAMAVVNEAYRVLADPGRRAVYDASRRAPSSRVTDPVPTTTSVARPTLAPLAPARVPWRLMATMAGIGAMVVVVLAAFARPSEPPAPDNLIGTGSCVIVEANLDAREVTCPADGASETGTGIGAVRVVRELVASTPECPMGTDAHRDRQGRGIACLSRPARPFPARELAPR